MWAEYKLSADEASVKAAAYNTFCSLWRQLVPHIIIMKPMSDLCWVCQQNSVAIMRAANTPDSAKSQVAKLQYYMGGIIICIESQVLKDAGEHLRLATQERSYYRSAIEASKEVLRTTFTVDGSLRVPPVGSCLPPLSHEIEMHFSLDMAQQVQAAKLI